jgi:glucoamylase
VDQRDLEQAPGAPGISLNWCQGAKQLVGTSLGPARVWFTVGRGILNEVYYPRIDIPQLRDLGFIVADDAGFWVELKAIDDCTVETPAAGIPAARIVHHHPRFTLIQRLVPEPNRDVLLLQVSLEGDPTLRPYLLLNPHLGATGAGNLAELAEHGGRRVLLAEQGPFSLALAAVDDHQCDALGVASAGIVGVSDAWQDFHQNGRMTWHYRRAGPGYVALCAGLPRQATLGLGFGTSGKAAATLAISALLQPFALIWEQHCRHWQNWLGDCGLPAAAVAREGFPDTLTEQLHTSAMVLRSHQDQTFRGAMVASLSVPWGEQVQERPGYHLVWPRDLVECAGALLALGAEVEAREILRYLIATQRPDGSWYQNQWLGGKPFWIGVQLDQIAFPVLLAGTLAELDALDGIEVKEMVRRALGFLVRKGPVSPQDRWEENPGVNAFTLAVCIAGLVAGARFLDASAEGFVLELADYWNARLEDWTAVRDTELARRHEVPGYYIRIAPPEALVDPAALSRVMPVRNRFPDPGLSATDQIGVDFLQLVRFGLRRPDDPLVRGTLTLVDRTLRVELPQGPCWYRYTGDGYGEQDDGGPYVGTGRGRLWPLLTGERGHYELAAGRDAMPYLAAMAAMAGPAGMLPEQVWDRDAIPGKGLYPGGPNGSAMPLAWAHAEYVKLAYSILNGRPIDRPEPLWARYHGYRPTAHLWYWSPQVPIRRLPAGVRLGICLQQPAEVRFHVDDDAEQRLMSQQPVLDVHVIRLPELPAQARRLSFRLLGEGVSGELREVVLEAADP